MDEFSALEDNSDMDNVSDASAISSGASPLSSDKRASIYDFIATFEEKKRAKKRTNPEPKKDDNLISFSPLTSFIKEAQI